MSDRQTEKGAAERSWPCDDSSLHVHIERPCEGWPYSDDHHRDLKYLYGERERVSTRKVSTPPASCRVCGGSGRIYDTRGGSDLCANCQALPPGATS